MIRKSGNRFSEKIMLNQHPGRTRRGAHLAQRRATVGAIVTAALTGQFALPAFTGPNLNEA
jgi:hypothetical protein